MDARSVVMVHGAGGGAWEWNVWRRVFEARGWDVHVPELSPAEAGLAATTLDDYVARIAGAASDARESEARRLVLVGASLGGLIAALVAERVDVAALVLVNPLPPAPWHAQLPRREPWPAIVPWGREASLQSTRRSLFDADDATCLYAYQRWRDESGAVMNAAHSGVAVGCPGCPLLVLASERDDDVPPAASRALAQAWHAALMSLPGASHVGPILGRSAAACAEIAETWLRLARADRS